MFKVQQLNLITFLMTLDIANYYEINLQLQYLNIIKWK